METVQHSTTTAGGVAAPQRSRADVIARRMLFIKDRPESATKRSAERAFQRSMMISDTFRLDE